MGDLGVKYALHLQLVEKLVAGVLTVIIELFSLYLMAETL